MLAFYSSLQCIMCIILNSKFCHTSLVESCVVVHGQVFSWPTCSLLCHTSQFRIWYILSIMKCSIMHHIYLKEGRITCVMDRQKKPPTLPQCSPLCHTSQLSPNPSQPFSLISSSFRKAGISSQFRHCF